jgi:hypothetical protein
MNEANSADVFDLDLALRSGAEFELASRQPRRAQCRHDRATVRPVASPKGAALFGIFATTELQARSAGRRVQQRDLAHAFRLLATPKDDERGQFER